MYLIQSFVGYNRAKEMVSSSGYWESRDFGIWVIDGMCKNYGFEVIYLFWGIIFIYISFMGCLDG